jgi:segregation and condensation protein B
MEMTDDQRNEYRRATEALLVVAEEPISPNLLAQLFEVSVDIAVELCEEVREQIETERRGFVIQRVAGGYRFATHPDLSRYVERFALDGQSSRLSAAALETLAIIAYKQPVTRAQIAAIRGVNADAVVRTLEHRGFISVVDRDAGPGQASLYGTTPLFLERLDLDSVDDLAPLGDFVPGAHVIEALERGLQVEEPDETVGEDSGEVSAHHE